MIRQSIAAVVLVAGISAAGAALADDDRDPTPAERTKIEAFLKTQGYVGWDDIELEKDNGFWEVDDARDAQGKRFDLKLRPNTLEVVSRRADD